MGERSRAQTALSDTTHKEFEVFRLVTTRGNAVGLLSGGFLFPRGDAMPMWAQEDKFHRDPSALIAEYLLLFTGAPGAAVTRDLLDQAEGQFPVILEINPRYLAQPNLVVDRQYNVVPGQNGLEGSLAWLMHGLIPTAAIDRVIFRSQNDLNEFRARPLGNFDPESAGFEMRVNPNDFLDRTIDAYRLREALLHGTDADITPVPSANATALGGAAILLGSVAERRSDFPLSRMRELLDALRGTTAVDSPAGSSLLNTLPDRLLPIPGKTIDAGYRAEPGSAEHAFLLFLDALVPIQPQEFVPMSVLGKVNEQLQQTASPHTQTLTLFTEVLDGFASINQVPEDTPDLLMAIFDVCRAGGLPERLSSADAPALALDREIGAAVLAGVLLGRDRISIKDRPSSRPLLDRLDGAIARRSNEAAGSPELLPGGRRVTVEIMTTEHERVERLLAGGHELLERRTPLDEPSQTPPVPAISGASLATLCDRAGWRDLIALEFPEPLRLQLESSGGQETGWIRLQGVTLSQAVVIVDREKVSQRLAAVGTLLDESLRAELSRVLAGQAPEPGLPTTPQGADCLTNEDKSETPQAEIPDLPAAQENVEVVAASKPPARTRKSSGRKPKESSAGSVSAEVTAETKAPTTRSGRRRKNETSTADTETNLPLLEAVEQVSEG